MSSKKCKFLDKVGIISLGMVVILSPFLPLPTDSLCVGTRQGSNATRVVNIKPIEAINTQASNQVTYKTGSFNVWEPEAAEWASKNHKAIFIHFTGDGCLTCKAQWASFEKDKLYNLSNAKDFYLFEANLVPGKDNSYILATISKYNLGGVPAYVYIDSQGKETTLTPGLWSANNIFKNLEKLV